MSQTITFINEKGGIGKTSTCFNLAWAMSEKEKILIIDLDGQRANLSFFAGIEKTDNMPTMYNVLNENEDIKNTIIHLKENLDIIPATSNVTNLSQSAKVSKMKKIIESIKSEYSKIFIDVNPSPNWTHVLSLSSADYVIIPMLPDITSLEANKGIAESIEEIKEVSNPNLRVLGIVFNKNTNRTVLSKQVKTVADKVAEQLGTKVFDTKIRDAVVLTESVALHKGVTEYAPKSAVAGDILTLAKEIERRLADE